MEFPHIPYRELQEVQGRGLDLEVGKGLPEDNGYYFPEIVGGEKIA